MIKLKNWLNITQVFFIIKILISVILFFLQNKPLIQSNKLCKSIIYNQKL